MVNLHYDSSARAKAMRCLKQTPEITLRDSAISGNGNTMADTFATPGASIKRIAHHQQPMSRLDDHQNSIASQIGPMRAYARALAVNRDAADMVVTAAITKSCADIDTVAPGTDIRTWLFGNLHSAFYMAPRQVDGWVVHDTTIASKPCASGNVTPETFSAAFVLLPVTQREALFLTAAARLSFRDAATVCGCSVIMLKRRAIAGRARLSMILFLTKGTGAGHGGDAMRRRTASS